MTPQPGRIFYWTGLTATQPFNSGVQRVTRALGRALHRLNIQVVPVKWDTSSERITPLDEAESAHLAKFDGPSISSTEPLPTDLTDEWLLLPEIIVPVAPPGSNAIRLARSLGMKIAAIFYDLIPAKMPELYQAATMDEFAAYWDAFAEADLALPISWTTAADLCRYLTERELRVPQVVPCTLAGDLSGHTRQRTPRHPPEPGEPLRLLAVGTWEPRKNYPRLLRAIAEARLLAPERPIRLTIVGFHGGWAEHVAEIERLAAEVGDIDLHDHISDQALLRLYSISHATIYGSWEEGFGLPVVESLWHGLPCLCHDGSAMAETAPGGGVIALDMLDQAVIACSIARLAREDGLLDRLMREAVTQPIRTWDEYAQDVMSAIGRTGITALSPSPAARVRHVKLLEVPAFDLALHEDPTDRFISAEIGRTGTWEPLETELVRRLLPHYRRFIDLGANLGWYTVIAGLLLRGRGKVHAFEPALSNFRLLENNVGMNGLDNVRLHQIAVGNHLGTTTLFLAADNQGDHSLHGSGKRRPSARVPLTTLDAHFGALPSAPFLLKSDTQGAEPSILAGARQFLRCDNGNSAFIMEFWPFGIVAAGWTVLGYLDAIEHLGREVFVIDEVSRCLWRSSVADLAEAARGDLRPETGNFRNIALLPAELARDSQVRALLR